MKKNDKGLWWINIDSKRLKDFRMKIYNSKQWKVTRAYVLSSNPFCVKCVEEGKIVKATDVDHIKPLSEIYESGDIAQAYAVENLQGLCHTCHSKKSYTEGLGKLKKNKK
jgi:5-methylcytosine-specific restriction endonuclease McrA